MNSIHSGLGWPSAARTRAVCLRRAGGRQRRSHRFGGVRTALALIGSPVRCRALRASIEDRPPRRAASNADRACCAATYGAMYRLSSLAPGTRRSRCALRTAPGRNVSSSACLRNPTPQEPPVPRLKPMMRITVRMWRKRHSWNAFPDRPGPRTGDKPPSACRCPRRCARTPAATPDRTRAAWTSRVRSACGHRMAAAREEAQRLVVQARRFQRLAQHAAACGSCANTLQHVGVLVAEQEFHRAVLQRLESGRRPQQVAELHVFGRRQRLQHRPHLGQLAQHLLAAREDLLARAELVARRCAIAARNSWIISLIHSSAPGAGR